MDYKLEDIVDIQLLQKLQDKLNVIYSFPSAIIDNEGKILTAVAWQDICTKFHRVNPESEKECIKSDQYIYEHLHEAKPAVSYLCPHGLVDNATPIVIDGKHLGNFFTGQFFLEKPDMEFFKQQAVKFGFDEKEYLLAVKKVPIWNREKLNQYLDFIKGFIEIIAGIGLKNLKEIEANKKIKESEERYRQLFDVSPDGIVHIGNDGLITQANIEEARMFGYNSPEELVGVHATLLVGLTSRDFSAQIMQRRLNGENLPPVEYELVRRDGTIFYGEVSAAILRNDDGSVSGYICITHNTTERRRTEIMLRESEGQFRSTFEQTSVGMAHVSLEGKWLRVNQQLCVILGYTREELITKSFQDLTHPDDLVSDVEYLDRMVAKEIQSFSREKRYIRKDGSIVWASLSATSFINSSGNLEYIISAIKDISDRKRVEQTLLKSEEKFAKAFRMSPEAISIASMEDGKYIDVNDVFCKTTGFMKEEIIGHTSSELNVWVDLSDREKYREKLLKNNFLKNFNTRFRMHSGEIRYFLISSEVIELEGKQCSLNFMLDTTDQKLAVEALKESEEKFKYIFENSVIGKSITYISGEINVNRAFCNMIGYTTEELRDRKWQEITYPDDIELTRKEIEKLISGQKDSTQFVKRFVHKDGSIIWVEVGSFLRRDKDGNPNYFISTLNDITERRMAEEVLKKSESRFRDILSFSPMPIALNDANQNITYLNQTFVKTFGYTLEDIPTLSHWWPAAYPNPNYRQWVADSWKAELENMRLTGKEFTPFEVTVRCKNGMERTVLASAALFSSSFENNHVVLLYDITDRKLAEEEIKNSNDKLRSLLNGIPESAFLINPEGIVLTTNETTVRRLNCKMEDFVGSSAFDFLPESIREKRRLQVAQSLMSAKPIRFEDNRNGIAIDNSLTPIIDEKGNVTGIVVIGFDITHRKRAEAELEIYRNHLEELIKLRTEELNVSNEELQVQLEKQKEYELLLQQSLIKEQELNELKSRFISTASHEFRTPLTSILSSAGLIQRYADKWESEKRNEHLTRIQNSVVNLTRLLDDVLTIGKTESGNISFNPEMVDLQRCAEECLQDALSLIENKHELKFDYTLEKNKFQLDPKLVRFILNNLLSNAVKYSPDGGKITLAISTNEDNIIIQVSDEGIGIPSEERDRIFDSFYRSKNAGEIKGTGLGLAIVKRAVDLHEGKITVKSELGKGTKFTVKIPIRD